MLLVAFPQLKDGAFRTTYVSAEDELLVVIEPASDPRTTNADIQPVLRARFSFDAAGLITRYRAYGRWARGAENAVVANLGARASLEAVSRHIESSAGALGQEARSAALRAFPTAVLRYVSGDVGISDARFECGLVPDDVGNPRACGWTLVLRSSSTSDVYHAVIEPFGARLVALDRAGRNR
jgi:hypothetical protein